LTTDKQNISSRLLLSDLILWHSSTYHCSTTFCRWW